MGPEGTLNALFTEFLALPSTREFVESTLEEIQAHSQINPDPVSPQAVHRRTLSPTPRTPSPRARSVSPNSSLSRSGFGDELPNSPPLSPRPGSPPGPRALRLGRLTEDGGLLSPRASPVRSSGVKLRQDIVRPPEMKLKLPPPSRASPPPTPSPGLRLREINVSASIPSFYSAKPCRTDETAAQASIDKFFSEHPLGVTRAGLITLMQEACRVPSFCFQSVFDKLSKGKEDTKAKAEAKAAREEEGDEGEGDEGEEEERVSKEVFEEWFHANMQSEDQNVRLFNCLTQTNPRWLEQADLEPLVDAVVQTHPGLEFLTHTPEFQIRYAQTVIARVFYQVNKAANGRISLRELERSNFCFTLNLLDREEDINKINQYFSYEHFYVVYCQFWQLDTDHDRILSSDDLQRYDDFALTSPVIARIMEGVPRALSAPGEMSYLDFVVFVISEVDKKTDAAVDYWFSCLDLDGDGVLSPFELELVFEEQQQRMQAVTQEEVLFQDVLCQLIDMTQPRHKSGFSKQDLKRCGMADVFFNTMFNLNQYLLGEQRDPLFIKRRHNTPQLSDWDRYAILGYYRLADPEELLDEVGFGDIDELMEARALFQGQQNALYLQSLGRGNNEELSNGTDENNDPQEGDSDDKAIRTLGDDISRLERLHASSPLDRDPFTLLEGTSERQRRRPAASTDADVWSEDYDPLSYGAAAFRHSLPLVAREGDTDEDAGSDDGDDGDDDGDEDDALVGHHRPRTARYHRRQRALYGIAHDENKESSGDSHSSSYSRSSYSSSSSSSPNHSPPSHTRLAVPHDALGNPLPPPPISLDTHLGEVHPLPFLPDASEELNRHATTPTTTTTTTTHSSLATIDGTGTRQRNPSSSRQSDSSGTGHQRRRRLRMRHTRKNAVQLGLDELRAIRASLQAMGSEHEADTDIDRGRNAGHTARTRPLRDTDLAAVSALDRLDGIQPRQDVVAALHHAAIHAPLQELDRLDGIQARPDLPLAAGGILPPAIEGHVRRNAMQLHDDDLRVIHAPSRECELARNTSGFETRASGYNATAPKFDTDSSEFDTTASRFDNPHGSELMPHASGFDTQQGVGSESRMQRRPDPPAAGFERLERGDEGGGGSDGGIGHHGGGGERGEGGQRAAVRIRRRRRVSNTRSPRKPRSRKHNKSKKKRRNSKKKQSPKKLYSDL